MHIDRCRQPIISQKIQDALNELTQIMGEISTNSDEDITLLNNHYIALLLFFSCSSSSSSIKQGNTATIDEVEKGVPYKKPTAKTIPHVKEMEVHDPVCHPIDIGIKIPSAKADEKKNERGSVHRSNSNKICHGCGQSGHLARNCQTLQKEGDEHGGNDGRPCVKKGGRYDRPCVTKTHYRRQCRHVSWIVPQDFLNS